jgi:Flp pilus assembly pilin Flp
MGWTRAQLWCARLFSLPNRNEGNEEGSNMVEYMLLLVLIAILLIVIVTQIGYQVSTRFSSASSAMP